MKASSKCEMRDLLPAWITCVLAPAPAILVSKDGAAALMYFFVACAGLVAYTFRREISGARSNAEHFARTWRSRMLSSGAALFTTWLVFCALCMTLPPPHNYIAALLGVMLLVPCLCIVPYLMLVTQQPFAAVVFAITLVVCVKLAGCALVCAVYGWDASEHGHTSMPWIHPNLLVWAFLIGTGILSAAFYFFGARRWHCSRALDA